MENNILRLLKNKDVTIALIGATNDSSKYGNIIYKDLKRKNISVYGINPKASTIEGDKAFHRIEDLGFIPDILNFVIPPKLGFPIIKNAIESGFDNFWLQPGAESDEILSFLEQSGKNYLANACVMVETR
jgi:predicted CoA-binding protein